MSEIDYDKVRQIVRPIESSFDALWENSTEYTKLLFNYEWDKYLSNLEKRNYLNDITIGSISKNPKIWSHWKHISMWILYLVLFWFVDELAFQIFISAIFVVSLIGAISTYHAKHLLLSFNNIRLGMIEDELNFYKCKSKGSRTDAIPDFFDIPNLHWDDEEKYIECEKYYYNIRLDILRGCQRKMQNN
ncbi:hypothetical protein MCEREM21A_02418 [Sphingomonadaceae bacterium]